jgi:S-layer homology domain.
MTRIFPTAEQLSEAFAAESDGIRIEAADIGDSVKMDLPAAPLLHALEVRPDVLLEWSVNGNALLIPLRVLQGVSEEETVTFTIAVADGSVSDAWNEWITRSEAEPLLPHPMIYSFQTHSGDRIDWDPAYATLTAALPEPADPDQATAVRVDENGRMRFAPSVFSNDGSPLATIRAPYAGAYSVIRSDHSFVDLNGHWARKDIVLMANKLIVEGRTQDRFVPDDPISRAEFAALLVRAHGLDDDPNGPTPFRDVAPGAWYAGVVRAAYQHRLIYGFGDGTFRPSDTITREQMAVMIVRAMEYAGYAPDANRAAAKTFADEADIAPWADAAVDMLTRASIINGLTETRFGPREYATRAQSAVLLKRMLQAMQWINP